MISENVSLKGYNTFALNIKAKYFTSPATEQEVTDLINSGYTRNHRLLITGSGSNLLFTSDFDGLVIHPGMNGINRGSTSRGITTVSVGAGVIWDDFVVWAISNRLSGIENLSLIPGTTGATAVQNIGAYGVEAAEVIEKVHAIDLLTGTMHKFSNNDCLFGYRSSIFKNELRGRMLITSVTFNLKTRPDFNLTYGDLRYEAEKAGEVNSETVRMAVAKIRMSKLPDPAVLANAGSFFKNPVVPESHVKRLKDIYPSMPVYPVDKNGSKLAAGWLIDQCSWKGFRAGDAGVHDRQALVLVNYGNATGNDIYNLSEKIRISVAERFGVNLEREVEVI